MSELELRNIMEQETTILTNVKLYPEGIGAVAPTGLVDDREILDVVTENQKPVTDQAKVCIDGRPELEHQPVRQKMAGGNLATAFVAAELVGWNLYTYDESQAPAEVRLSAIADHLVTAGEVLGGHVDNHATEEKSNCGAADGLPKHIGVIAEHGNDTAFLEQMQDALGDGFSQEIWDAVIAKAQNKIEANAYTAWSGQAVISAIRDRNGVVEVLNGDNHKAEQDPEDMRHNHWEEAVVVNTVPGVSNDRDNSHVQHFQVDAPALIETCQRMASSTDEFASLLHAAVGYQFAVRYNLTSNQRNIYL